MAHGPRKKRSDFGGILDYVKLWLGWGRLVIQIIAILTVRWGLTQTCNTGTYYPMT